jgi:fucose permease
MESHINRSRLMVASFLTLVASGMGFAARTAMKGVWESQFNIGGQEFGLILGAGFLGFGIMIFFGGIITEKIGFKTVLVIAFLLHLISAVMLFAARPVFEYYQSTAPNLATPRTIQVLYWSCFVFSIAQGLYEAVINPLIARLYPEDPTHYLNVLHAGWPGGMIIGGLIAAGFIGKDAAFPIFSYWEIPLTSFALCVLLYGVLALPEKFPQTVAAKTQNFGELFSCFLSPVFLLLLILHAGIGYTELGIDSWVASLMSNVLTNPVLLLVYTSSLMFVLRFFAGPIVHKINPIGLLFVCSVLAAVGLFWLGSGSLPLSTILIAATVYTLGKTFFWPTMLGVAGERYPRSGAVAMGALGAMGMLTVGLLSNPAIGYKSSSNASHRLSQTSPATFERYAEPGATNFLWLPEYRRLAPNLSGAVNKAKPDEIRSGSTASFNELKSELGRQLDKAADEESKAELRAQLAKIDEVLPYIAEDAEPIKQAIEYGNARALTLTAYVPATMAVGYLILLIYFAAIGGYKKIELDDAQ